MVQRLQPAVHGQQQEGKGVCAAAGNDRDVAVTEHVHQPKVGLGHLLVGPDVVQRHGQRHLQGNVQCILSGAIKGVTHHRVTKRLLTECLEQTTGVEG